MLLFAFMMMAGAAGYVVVKAVDDYSLRPIRPITGNRPINDPDFDSWG